jgi:tetratricopeptide (TPR) repeat protein
VNESGPPDIPSSRRRLAVVLGLALTAGICAAVTVALAAGGGGSGRDSARCATFSGAPPLQIELPKGSVKGTVAQLHAAERELPGGDIRIAVARAIAGYSSNGAAATLAALRALPHDQAVVSLHLGLAEIWAGQCTGVADLKRTRTLDPYGFYGTLADDALHAKDQLRGYPLYIAPAGIPGGSLATLRTLARRQPNRSDVWLALAYRLQIAHHRDALADARRALELDPTGISPRVAVAVLGYSKDNPSASFAVLGPLSQQVSDATEIRFHLGMLLYWLKQNTDAEAQWRQVEQDSPDSAYGRVAAGLMQKLGAQ